MIKVIAYTDSVNQCECCGKSNLKGTFCVDIDGVERYFGSTCAFKKHGVSETDGKAAVSQYKREQSMLKITGFKTWAEWEAAQNAA